MKQQSLPLKDTDTKRRGRRVKRRASDKVAEWAFAGMFKDLGIKRDDDTKRSR